MHYLDTSVINRCGEASNVGNYSTPDPDDKIATCKTFPSEFSAQVF
jgi:hypothetical protein